MPAFILSESFHSQSFDPRLRWANPPERFQVVNSCLRVEPGAKTDYWQVTHYGFAVDNGPFLYLQVSGDFILTTRVRMHPAHQYDQAGLMVHLSPGCWLKTSVEYDPEEGGVLGRLGAVVTNDYYSDWSTQAYSDPNYELSFRIRREASDYIVETSPDEQRWTQIRMAHLTEDDGARAMPCGLYACSPIDAGYHADFKYLRIQSGRLG